MKDIINHNTGAMEEQKLTPSSHEKDANSSDAASVSDLEEKHDKTNPWLSRNTASRVELTWKRLSSKSPLELHQRCAETIERCSAGLRERQRKMERLGLVLPLPNTGHHQEDSHSTPKRSTPRPTKRNKHSTAPLRSREKSSPDIISPAWSISSTRSARLRFDAVTTSPLIKKNNTQANTRIRVSPNTSHPSNEKVATQESTPASTDKSTDSREKSTLLSPTWSQRQQDFMAAIEAEADDGMTP